MGAKVGVAIVEANKFARPFRNCGVIVINERQGPEGSERAGGKGSGDTME